MKPYSIINTCILLLLASITQAMEVHEKPRKWTLENGKTARAKLVEILKNEKKIILAVKGKKHTYELSDFSQADNNYVREVINKLPRGKIKDYAPKFAKEEDKKYYNRHAMTSVRWTAKDYEKLPLMIYSPRIVGSEKLPAIVYLHGTGGMGTDNTKPFFNDANGVLKKLLDPTFQKKHPCYVIAPQIQRKSGWFSAHFTDPTREQSWLKDAIRLLAQDKRFGIDLDRLYIMGLSMGGHGVYEATAKLENFYAAGVAISAVDDGLSLFKNNCGTPLWVILNKGDRAEPVEMLNHFAAKFRKFGGKIKITLLDGAGHNAWDRAFGDKKFVTMLFRQKKK